MNLGPSTLLRDKGRRKFSAWLLRVGESIINTYKCGQSLCVAVAISNIVSFIISHLWKIEC